MAPCDLASCGLPHAWAQQHAWTVLDTDVRDGHHFLNIWRAWLSDPQRPRMLHYVALANAVPEFAGAPAFAAALVAQVAARSVGLGPGFHRILLDQGQVSLTLCVGHVADLLAEHVFQADTLIARAPADKWAAQALARRCKRGSHFWMPEGATPALHNLPDLLRAAGFQSDAATAGIAAGTAVDTGPLTGRYDPPWDIRTSRQPTRYVHAQPARCAVVGAGIAGASVAHGLALRGWQVTVLDQAAAPAAGASGLPVGLAVPHVSADDNPRSRLSRAGIHLLHQHAEQLLVRGGDWDASGVLERRADGSTLWHAQACWIKPAQLVRAWLNTSGIHFAGHRRVAKVRQGDADKLWRLSDNQGQSLGEFETVVVATAMDSAELLDGLWPADGPDAGARNRLADLQAVHGTLSHGRYAQPIPGLPATPVNGNGCFIPQIPSDLGRQWFAGSTFVTDAVLAADAAAQHAANMQRLQHLLPEMAGDLVEALNRGPVATWSSTRCTTQDRLPLVGPVDGAYGPGMWLCVGMGSRGLSFSALCAQLLVARLCGEPLPLESGLARSLDVNRPRRRQQTLPPDA